MPRAKGFTLTELAVVLVIVSLLLGGLIVPLSAQMDMRNTDDTRKSLAEAREALLGFAASNGRLPCPAPATTATGVAGAGIEARSGIGDCVSTVGVLPWATLGVPETDAWGRRYSYRVTAVFAQHVHAPQNAAFLLSSRGDLQVWSSLAGGGGKIGSDVPAVVISHGKNGNGAYTPQGTRLPAGADVDEAANIWTNAGVPTINVVSKTQTTSFDDEVVWLSPGVLFNRMLGAGRLP